MINDYYFDIVTKQQTSELHAQADQDRLAKQVREERRAARRETARLAEAVNGRWSGFWAELRKLVTPHQSPAGGADTTPRPQPESNGAPHPVPEPELTARQQIRDHERVPVEH